MPAFNEDVRKAFNEAFDEAPHVDREAFQAFLGNVFHNWTSKDPIPMPTLAVHTFAQSSIEVGRMAQDLPVETGSVISDKRKKNAKAYLMVKVNHDDDDSTSFLWCDADGKPVKRNWIKKTRGLVISQAKQELVEDYNNLECTLVDQYNSALRIAHARMRVVKFAERERLGLTETPAFDGGDEWEFNDVEGRSLMLRYGELAGIAQGG